MTNKNQVILDVIIDKKQKMKVRSIIIDGNKAISDSKIKGGLFRKGAFSKTHEAGKLSTFLKSKKFTPERWKADKQRLIEKYNENGYRDAVILKDSVWNVDDRHVNVYVKVEEGQKYYLRDITWVGNTVYPSDLLAKVLGMKKGDVYNQKLMNKRLNEDDDAVGNLYWNNGYIFYQLTPAEINIDGDSIDLEMRIIEGPQARVSRVRINGNDRLYENVVRRELRTKPGDLFSRESLMRSAREIAAMGHFNEEKINPEPVPNEDDGTVDINWNLEQKTNDQVEFSLGWGQTGVIGRVGVKLTNFSMRNLFNKNREHRGIMPIGDGEVLSFGAQTNGTYYQSYNVNYSTNWFGGKRPIQFNVGVFFSKQTDVSSNYYNSAYFNNYYNYLYGYGSSIYNNYENYYDPDKYVQLLDRMGQAAPLAGRLLHSVAAARLYALHAEELELLPSYQWKLQQPQLHRVAQPCLHRQPAFPEARFGVPLVAVAHSAMVGVGQQRLQEPRHKLPVAQFRPRAAGEIPLDRVSQVEAEGKNLHRAFGRQQVLRAHDAS